MLIKEKANYIFRNYKHVTSGRVVFTGCNFPSYFPKTTKYLADLLEKKAGIGIIYDCCGKPIAELGLEKEEQAILRKEWLDKFKANFRAQLDNIEFVDKQ